MILIIDDDIAVRTSLQLLLENEGYKTTSADGPGEALTFLKTSTPELIILDLNFSIDTSEKKE
jgi:CheY-like chemotaxis protein